MKSIILTCLCVVSIWAVSADVKNLQKNRLKNLNNNFYVKAPQGGEDAKAGQFPWQVAIRFTRANDIGRYVCGGALVDLKWVLTSASCVYEAIIIALTLGSNTLSYSDVDPYRVTAFANYSLVHPDYVPPSLENDIALIMLDTTVKPNDFVQVIALSSIELDDYAVVTISGWGTTSDADGVSVDLQFMNLTIILNADCQSYYGENRIPNDTVCALGENSEELCNGESGSAVVARGPGGNFVQVGIALGMSSAGCENTAPSAFTRTSLYVDWITKVIT